MMWRRIPFPLAVFLVLSTVNVSSLRMSGNYSCYNSSDPAALNASLLYNDHSDIGEFWTRDDLQKPLPACSSFEVLLLNRTCEVCREEQVFAVCQDLPKNVVLLMESSKSIKISSCACDQLANNAKIPTPAGTNHWSVPTAVSIIIIILLAAAVFISRNCLRKRRSEDKQDPEAAAISEPLNGVELTNIKGDSEIPNGRD